MAYIILVNDDDTLYGSHKERIMQRQKLVNDLVFIVEPMYKNIYDMTNASVMMEYILPVSREYKSEYLVLSDERYKDCYLQYKLPIDSNLTREAGEIELQLTFAYVEMDANGNCIQRVRKTSTTTIKVTAISAWSDIIPDSALTALDQRIIMQSAQIRALADLANVIDDNKVDNLVYDSVDDTLQLSANGIGVGNKVAVKDMLKDGVPVVDLNTGSNSDEDADSESSNGCSCNGDCGCEDNVVEFGDVITPELPNENDDNVIEF